MNIQECTEAIRAKVGDNSGLNAVLKFDCGDNSGLNAVLKFDCGDDGKIVIDGSAERLANDPDVREFYLGFAEGGTRKSMREVKHYKRRKRWLS